MLKNNNLHAIKKQLFKTLSYWQFKHYES
jgi:hypothetical protein